MIKTTRITLIAASVVAALGSTANAQFINTQSLVHNSTAVTQDQNQQIRAAQQALAAKPTKSGMASSFDADLGKATFVWAPSDYVKPNFTGIAKADQAKFSANFYLHQLTGLSVAKSGDSDATLVNFHEAKKGPSIAKYKQSVAGVEVFNREFNIMMDKELNLVAASGYLSTNKLANGANPQFAHFGDAQDAIRVAASNLGVSDNAIHLSGKKVEGDYVSFQADFGKDKAGFAPRAKKVFFDDGSRLIAAHYVEVEVTKANSVETEAFGFVISADNNKVLLKNDLVAHSNDYTYRVYAKPDGYPMEGPHGDVIPKIDNDPDKTEILAAPLVTLANYSKISTQDPWLPEGATITSGNNVFAYADVVAPDGFTEGDFTAETTSAMTFDYQLDGSQTANSMHNRKAAIVNLFYMTNFLHDFFYDYGFDEAAGNAQLSNYERGGAEGDPLHVQAQDYLGLNNANMSTPSDGRSPRMQQYLWTSKDAKVGEDYAVTVTSPSNIGLLQSTQIASYGPRQYNFSGEVVRINDGTATPHAGCETAINAADVAGKIAIIDRGACAFVLKSQKAQEAGAIGVLIVNNVDNGAPAPMGGEADDVYIPSMGLNFQDGKKIYDLIDNGQAVTVNMMNTFPLKDSTFDNGIIAHEWGHYISNRLVGNSSGLINFQGRAMGEGWGDFHSLMFLALESDMAIAGNDKFQHPYATGTYVEDFTTGIRRAPYSTDMSVNPLTFKHIQSGATPPGLPPTSVASPHAPGEIWATMLWDVYVGLINKHGFQEAQDRMATYLISGYKATPIAPTYVEARDAILASIYAADMEDFELALAAFARRGLGLGAIAPARFSTDNVGVTESYSTELSAIQAQSVKLNTNFNGADVGYCSNDNVLDKGETGTITVAVKNAGKTVMNNVTAKVVVTSGQNVTLENDGIITIESIAPFATVSSMPLKVKLNDAAIADTLTFEVTFPEQTTVGAPTLTAETMVNYDFTLKANDGLTATASMEGLTAFADFKEHVMKGGELAMGTQAVDTQNTAYFASKNPGVNFGAQTMFLANTGFESDVGVETEAFEVGFGPDFSVSFWHLYMLEAGWDGAVVEVSINGGNWVDVTSSTAGGQFEVGYNTEKLEDNSAQSLQDRPVFSGRNFDGSTMFGNVETIHFGESLNGQLVKFRFRISSDSNTADLGWFIDDVKFSNLASPVFHKMIAGDVNACDNVAPLVTVAAEVTTKESANVDIEAMATDRNGDTLTYAWTQVEGPTATVSGANTAKLTVTPPSITADAVLKFELAVSDGKTTTTSTTVVKVTNETPVTPTVPTVPTKKSSSGSLGWFAMLLAAAGLIRRRR
ncbi:rhombosortase-dependent M36 family metallopeptidase [Pseudoalteromonas fenneropenaei]|uniref:Rhombosortase-dependent M36 family metallopeptidase n=1 Tax=Pseudoalteromonas fenneropenaei TaxID=1737459 RepID=A0ABV7CG79_9GAMM